MSEKFWNKLARTVIKAGHFPFPVTDTIIELLQVIISQEQADFISQVFARKPNLNLEEIKKRIDWDEKKILDMLETLMNDGIISGTESKTTSTKVYRLYGPFPGMFEYTLMKGGETEREKKLVVLFDKLFKEMSVSVQANYDSFVGQVKSTRPVDRVVPVEENVDPGYEEVLPGEVVSKLIDDYEDIAKTHCYCRHEKDLLNDPCKVTKEKHNCILLGKSGKFAIEHGFAEPMTSEEAKKILKESEDYGLVHKVFHVGLDPKKDIEGICSCCKCCCGIFQLFYIGILPMHTITSYLAKVIPDKCSACGTCVEKCPMEAIELVDAVANINESRCIGCGVCVHHCPEEALVLERPGTRTVFVLPPKIKTE